MINGIIVINKEPKFTSHDVVAKMRGIAGQKKVGHTGTLDPEATGVLPVCFGKATKVCDLLTNKTKEYKATLQLGKTSDTQDIWGEILTEAEVNVTEEQVKETLLSFLGESMQIPPMYSALKVQGKKLYELAREGIEVERKARKIEVTKIEIEDISLPEVTFSIVCSKGTYIRTICHDVGEKLGCGGIMKSLQRTRVGDFDLTQAYTLSDLQELKDTDALEKAVLPVDSVFAGLKEVHVLSNGQKWIDNGNMLLFTQLQEGASGEFEQNFKDGEEVRVYKLESDGNYVFAAVYKVDLNRKVITPKKMFI